MKRIVIVGGGIMGSCIAYHLALAGAAADVVVIEPDPTYEFAATPRAVGGVRLQHALFENVEMSLYGNSVYSDFANQVTGGTVQYDPQFYRMGYLYLVQGAAEVATLTSIADMLESKGVRVHRLDRSQLRSRYPSFHFNEADAGTLTPDDGQIDPNAALMGFRRGAEGRGIRYLKDRVVGLDVAGGLVTHARLASGESVAVDTLVNVANCWAADICNMVDVALPVEPRQRQQFFFDTQVQLEPIPAMRHAAGHAMRRLQKGYITGYTPVDQSSAFNWELDYSAFDAVLWPRLASQSSAFDAIKMKGGWVGHYDMNLLDGNPVIDRLPTLPNFIVAAGFSGHGLQHGPAVGRAVKEMILDGGFRSIDLSRFNYRRILDNAPLPDDGPVA
ncbi:FAD-binding oxidoreductase [Acidisphaera sp. S103]|uniref:NAD(P)/FAD-dependent oxidoreductase n=1 Tax=Acidisphaera sp. S103 TaxID=1747223 RepID=UPI00131C3517|nr:FAD-binding oxidoreductase [Acidisphaera sp. S103]